MAVDRDSWGGRGLLPWYLVERLLGCSGDCQHSTWWWAGTVAMVFGKGSHRMGEGLLPQQ